VPPVQPVEAGAERRCTDSHRAAKQRQNCKPQYRGHRGTRTEGPSVPYTHTLRQHFLSHFDIEDPDHELAGSGDGGLRKYLTASGNCKVICHAAAVSREALPRFTLGGTFLHVMISYRNATEGESGNNLSFQLYEKIRELSLADKNLKIPRYAWGTWPLFARKPASFQCNQAKVYLNRECLHYGQDWEVGVVHGLSSSMVLVCLLSFEEHGSLGDLTTLKPSEGTDRVDFFLLELIVGHEIRALGEYSALCTILPVLLGPQRKDSSFEPFPFSKLGLLSQEPSVMTNNRAASFLAMHGVGDKQIQAMQARSVRQHVDLILKNEGIHASAYATQDELVLESARKCLMVVRREIFIARTNPIRYANNRPMGQEVVDWLCEKDLSAYFPIFMYHVLDDLVSVSDLSRAQVSTLVAEYRDLQEQYSDFHPLNHEESLWWVTSGHHTGGNTTERERLIQSEDHLWNTIRTLDHEPNARTMAWRLEWFEDSAAAWHFRGEATTQNMGACPLPPGLTSKKKVALHIHTRTLTFICT
jgi:hypothetical protein